jgi:hypothetical protein
MKKTTTKKAVTKKVTTKKTQPFSDELMEFIKEGQRSRSKFLDLSEDLKRISPKDKFPHHYIYSQAGLGKSHTVKTTFAKAGIVNYSIFNGGISMNGIINELAVIVRNLKKNEHYYIYLEDCTNLFRKEEDLNIMKNVLNDERCIAYHKNPTKILNDATPTQREALRYYMSDNNGIKIPTHNLIFILTSNRKLPTQDEIRTKIDEDLYALRSRFNTFDFYMSPSVMWGYITDVIMNTNAVSKTIPQKVKIEACQFIYDNWSSLNERSIRFVQKMIEKYEKYPKNYLSKWESEFKK